MGSKVGIKGQIVISREIRDRLGVQPGWTALQRIVDDHVEIYFLPPQHERSLRGNLASYTNVTVGAEEWDAVRTNAWEQAAKDEGSS